MHDISTPPGQVRMEKTIGEIIDKVQRSEEVAAGYKPTHGGYPEAKRDYQSGYAEGYVDGKAAGFREGLAWATGNGKV